MNKFIKIFGSLRTPLIIFGAAIVLGVISVVATRQLDAQSQLELQKQQMVLSDARQRLLRSGEEREVIRRYLPEYRALEKQGFIGAEERIDWLDGLRSANQQADLFGVEYQVSPQEDFKAESALVGGGLPLRSSKMKLNFRLLHEEDLMRFFNALEKQGVGFFSIDDCSLERVTDIRNLQFQPYLGAKCTLAWISYNVTQTTKVPDE